ncbi:MAG TPA: ABC transporter permease subunit [Chloroflexota bacterium]|nr:ABC transporter permease subunit [Chloroflexota bacterium]
MAEVTREAPAVLQRPADRRPRVSRAILDWAAVIPFFAYIGVFLLLPALWLIVGAFQTESGSLTLDNIRALFNDQYANAYLNSVEISLATALTGSVCGFFVAYAAVKEGAPGWIRSVLSTFSGVAANFAGIPLAFAFVATLGTTGVVTAFLNDHGINLYQNGFTLYSFAGLVLVYTYFQLPLMILVISPALDGLRREWHEAATNLGATSLEYWRWVGLPILWPSLLGSFVLLFGTAFAAYATATSLVGSQISLVPILIGRVTTGDFASNPQMANALSLGMILIISVAMVIYALLQRRSSRWLQ